MAANKPKFDEDDLSDNEEIHETIIDRIVALKEFVPESTRNTLSKHADTAYTVGSTGFKWGSNAAWIVTTTVLLLVMPLVLAIETEQQLDEMEKQQQAQLQQQRQMLNPGLYGAPAPQR